MSENSLINIGELSKPATVLIEKISDAVGGIFEPYQIKRVAKAEAEAKVIEAKAEIEVTDIQRKAFRRFLKEEERKQKNIEEITRKALPQLADDAQPSNVEEDWIANFFDKSKLISNEEMQELWARILAGEANTPGSYSKRTVDLLSSLDKGDADLFTQLCGFGWYLGNVVPLIYNTENEIYNKNNITFNTISHLESIGVLQFENLAGYSRQKLPQKIKISYYGRHVELDLPKENNNILEIGKVRLTQVGQELAPICGSHPVDGFFEFVCEKWASQGYIKEEGYPPDDQPPIQLDA